MVAFAAVVCYVPKTRDATKITKKCLGLQDKSVPLAPAFLPRLQLKHPFILTACAKWIAVVSGKHKDLITAVFMF